MPPPRRDMQLRQLKRMANCKPKPKAKPKPTKPAERKCITDLPIELLAHIISLLPLEDICNVDCVSTFHGDDSAVEEALRLRASLCGRLTPADLPVDEVSWTQKLFWDERRHDHATRLPSMAGGVLHTAFIDASGALLTCGSERGAAGLLGHGNDVRWLAMPTAVPGLEAVTIQGVTASYHHTLALSSEGLVYSFGLGDHGRLGHGDEERQSVPRVIEALTAVKVCAIAAGCNHCLFADAHGFAYSCGSGSNGRLGHGSSSSSTRSMHPQHARAGAQASGLIVAWTDRVEPGVDASCGLVVVEIQEHQMLDRATPRAIKALRDERVCSVAAGHHSSFFLSASGRVHSCGLGSHGQLGHGDEHDCHVPRRVESLADVRVRAVASGRAHTLFLDRAGRAYSCGMGAMGRLGHGDDANQLSPRRIEFAAGGGGDSAGRDVVRAVAAGEAHSLCLTTGGGVYSFGWGVCGQLGHGDYDEEHSPRIIQGLVDVRDVAAGHAHSLAVDADGHVFGWGNGTDYCLGLELHGHLPTPLEYSHARLRVD